MSAFAWPIVVLIIVIIVIFVFRKQIGAKITGIKGVDGWKLNFENQGNNQQEVISPSLVDELSKDFNSDIVKHREGLALNALGINNISKDEEKITKLIRYIAIQDLMIEFDKTYWLIYGSQLELLKHVNSKKDSSDQLKSLYYETAKLNWPDLYANYSFEQYFNFLISKNLITSVEPFGNYGITFIGRDFLGYLIKNGFTFNKMY